MTADTVMKLTDVTRSFSTPSGPVSVLKSVTLEIRTGDFLVITGPSGSGKSTLLHLCALIDNPSSGTIFFKGRDITALSENEVCHLRKTEVGLVFQRFCLLPHRSVIDNVTFRFRYMDTAPANAETMARSRLSQMGISGLADRKARVLSAGEQQRVAIARATVQQPTILFADEPTGNLDKAASKAVMTCFKELNEKGLTVVMVTHNETLLSYASRHMVCVDGTVQEGPSR